MHGATAHPATLWTIMLDRQSAAETKVCIFVVVVTVIHRQSLTRSSRLDQHPVLHSGDEKVRSK